jgi:hypothetical protein
LKAAAQHRLHRGFGLPLVACQRLVSAEYQGRECIAPSPPAAKRTTSFFCVLASQEFSTLGFQSNTLQKKNDE